jgi:hypothetical protein
MLEAFNVPSSMLPTIEPSIGGNFGTIQTCGAVAGVPIGAILGDHMLLPLVIRVSMWVTQSAPLGLVHLL